MSVGVYTPGYESGLESTLHRAKEKGLSFTELRTPEELLKAKADIMIIDPTPGMDFNRIRNYIKANPKTSFLINGNLEWGYMSKYLENLNNVEYLSWSKAPGIIRRVLENDNSN